MRLLLVLISLWLDGVISTAFSSLDNERILHYAEMCNQVYHLDSRQSMDEMTTILRSQGLLSEEQKVVLQGFRNGDQLSVIVVKTGRNAFQFLFSGTETFLDGILDVMASATPEHVKTCLLSAHPTRIAVRIKKRNRVHLLKSTEHETVEVHKGFKLAGKDFMSKVFNLLKPYIEIGFDIFFDISGHSLGGALASQMAYHIKKRLAKAYQIPPEQIGMQVVTFAAAGYFSEEDLEKVTRVTDAANTMVHFYRHNDLARELTDLAGYKNPGNWVYLDNFVAVETTLADFLSKMVEFKESPTSIAELIKEELSNHTLPNYIITIKEAIEKQKNLIDGPNQVVVADDGSGSIFTPELVGTMKMAAAVVVITFLYFLATRRD